MWGWEFKTSDFRTISFSLFTKGQEISVFVENNLLWQFCKAFRLSLNAEDKMMSAEEKAKVNNGFSLFLKGLKLQNTK